MKYLSFHLKLKLKRVRSKYETTIKNFPIIV